MKIIRIDTPLGHADMKASLMSDSAARPHRRPLFLPHGEWQCQVRAAIRIDRLGKAIASKFASRYYGDATLVNYLRPVADNSDLTFDTMDDALVVGEWLPLDNFPTLLDFDGDKAAAHICRTHIDLALERLSANTTFKTGDIIVLPPAIFTYIPTTNRHIRITAGDDNQSQPLLEFNIK